MGGALAGALGGVGVLPRDWLEEVAVASRIDIEEAGREMAAVAAEIYAKDARRHAERARAMADLAAEERRRLSGRRSGPASAENCRA